MSLPWVFHVSSSKSSSHALSLPIYQHSLNAIAASEKNSLFDTNQNLECLDLSLLVQLNIKTNSPSTQHHTHQPPQYLGQGYGPRPLIWWCYGVIFGCNCAPTRCTTACSTETVAMHSPWSRQRPTYQALRTQKACNCKWIRMQQIRPDVITTIL